MSSPFPPTYESLLNDLAVSLSGPIALDDLIDWVLARRPSRAKNPRQAVRNALRVTFRSPFVFLDPKTLLPKRLAMEGARFRLPLGRRIARQGTLEMELFARYLRLHFPLREVRFVDTRDQPIPVLYRILEQKVEHPLYRLLGFEGKDKILIADLSVWLRRQNVTRRDDLLVTVLDWQNGVLRLEIEPHKKQQPALIQARDRLLADLLYQILENAADERIWIEDALPLAYARLPEKEACPPHHWQIVLEQDGRFLFDDSCITYADAAPFPIERLILEQTGSPLPRRLQPVTREQEKLVYRFKAVLKRDPHVWREVEIQGGQTLDDLNWILVRAFGHESDHVGGFWKRVPRFGTKTRYREVELGTVDPFGGGDGADVQIAAIGLSEGDELKYVFDFGDWIEHILTLEASIHPPEPGVEYPREISRSKPR
jgi:PAS domain-containing protein